ncbi:hypothetical protein PCC6912_53060 [Chlorogloeopsis fritschii PCC 6912]|uniref:HMA domain-containing protein n=2 Tax=Chlorogloeopsis fritschii TaxID=1124 RepID=A0A3S1FAM9_CHLFR|nr:hypothetical protein PCC6912_53060 [Chlorogloeopsis fritschii PCC 6912]
MINSRLNAAHPNCNDGKYIFSFQSATDNSFQLMTLQLKVPNMACSACADTITKAVQTIDASATVQADTKTKIVLVETNAPETAIKNAIANAGYTIA